VPDSGEVTTIEQTRVSCTVIVAVGGCEKASVVNCRCFVFQVFQGALV
jgi:hypothetical protein